MTKVILQPASGPGPQRHYKKTIENRIPLSEIFEFVSDAALKVKIENEYPAGSANLWGIVPGSNNTPEWRAVSPGDVALFYRKGRFISSMIVTVRPEGSYPELARHLWEEDRAGKTWELIYFLEHLRAEDIPYSGIWEIDPTGPKDFLGSVRVVDEEKSRAILDTFNLRRSGTVSEGRRSWDLGPGDTIKRSELHERFGGSPRGGISPCKPTPNVLVFSDPSVGHEHGYYDHWKEDVFHYCGEGQTGDQKLKGKNGTVANHKSEGRSLRVFDGSRREVRYVGEFEVDDEKPWYHDTSHATEGGPLREVIMFRLRPLGAFYVHGRVLERSKLEPTLSTPYREASRRATGKSSVQIERDPAETKRALDAHYRVQNELAKLVRSRELEPLEPGPGDPQFDIAWWDSDTLHVAEVKSVTDLNETRQLRLGLGQVLDYQDSLSGSAARVEAILALERSPTEDRWLALCERHGVRVFWSGHMPL